MADYNFCKFSFPNNANKVIWEITNECNYSCEYCIFSSTGKKTKGELTFEKVKQTIHELKEKGFNYIKFTGGEPFIRKDFIDILVYAKTMGIDFDVSTNASFITEEIAEKISLLECNFIHVSLDGHEQRIHETVRGKHSFAKTMNGLKILRRYNNNIRLGCVIHSENENNLQEIVNLTNDMDIPEIIFSIMAPIGKLTNKHTHLTTKTTQQLINEILALKTKKTAIKHNISSDLNTVIFSDQQHDTCPGGSKFLFIDSIGIVSPCTWISDKLPQFHHLCLQEYSLNEILQHYTFKHFSYEKQNMKGMCFAFHYNNKQFNTIYSFATENISFIDKLPIQEKNEALTVTGSGDQALQLVNTGFKNITCIDINPLSNYFAELKIAALKILSFEEFISFFKNSEHTFEYIKYKKLKRLLSPITEKFWNNQYLINNFQGNKIRNGKIFNLNYDSWENKVNNVPYLSKKHIYEEIQFKISSVNFKFIANNILDFPLHNKYDLILLSNVADYCHKMFSGDYIYQFKQNLIIPLLNKLNNKGILMFAYIYDYENKNNSHLRNRINLKEVRKEYFNDLNHQELFIKSAILDIDNDVICYIQKEKE